MQKDKKIKFKITVKCKHKNDYIEVIEAFDTHEITQRKCPDCGKIWKPKTT